jgi:hypothetical protein
METINIISREMNLATTQVTAVFQLLDQGSTIPFIARYRKEKTGSLDEVIIATIRDRIGELNTLNNRKESILKSLKERDLLTSILSEDIQASTTITQLEDLYEKYRPKKRTRAQMAKEKGLESLATFLLAQSNQDPVLEAKKYISIEKEVDSVDDAISHIHKYGSSHSVSIITSDYQNAQYFLDRVDAAAVYVNASTRFTDGFEFGYGAEIGISTQKLHARGPMGLPELTSYKYLIDGKGQIRG